MDRGALADALDAVGALLHDRGAHVEVVAIGGGGLLLLDLIERATHDLDLVALKRGDQLVKAEPLPAELREAAEDVARLMDLSPTWLNGGPTSMIDLGLPPGLLARATRRAHGGLVIYLASRYDQICFKLYATADDSPRGKHFADLRRLAPTPEELRSAAAWVITHDDSAGFLHILDQVLALFGAERDG